MTVDERLEFLLKSTESLHATAQDLVASTENLKATAAQHSTQLEQDGKHILAIASAVQGLTNIANAHETRLDDLEGGNKS